VFEPALGGPAPRLASRQRAYRGLERLARRQPKQHRALNLHGTQHAIEGSSDAVTSHPRA
jgi:hypothetical protein